MMRRMGRRGLVGAMATTAVVAGTATAVSGGVRNRQAGKQQDAAQDQAAQQAAFDSQQQIADMQAEMDAMKAQQAAPAPAAPAAAPAPASSGPNLEELAKLGELHSSGVLTDEEFAAAKAKLLG